MTAATILIADDDPREADALKRVIRASQILNPVQAVQGGREVISYLSGEGRYANRKAYPFPGIIFLDLVMPWKSGLDVLTWIRSRPDLEFKRVMIVVMTSLGNVEEIRQSYQRGANSFLIKPLNELDFMNLVQGHTAIKVDARADGLLLQFENSFPRC
jgi:CheY-like chemotaxis protein